MADEFVDFYEVLTLPLEADRTTVRKRINELYVEAQRNLDHRNFATRVKFQELFEITLPQARYILLDEGRRDDYDRMVQGSRGLIVAPKAAPKKAAPQTAELGQGASGNFKLSPDALPGPQPADTESALDPEAIAREREEMWKKWKSGLQTAMEREAAREKAETDAPRSAAKSTGHAIVAQIEPAPAEIAPGADTAAAASDTAAAGAASSAAAAPASKPAERPKVKFDFGGEPDNTPRRGEQAPVPGAEEFVEAAKTRLSPEEIERRRNEHRRELMKAELTDVGVKGSLIGSVVVLVPGVIAMVIFMSRYYPSGEAAKLPLASGLAWMLWLVFLGVGAFLAAHFLSKSLRRKSAMEMSLLSYQELLRHLHKEA